LNLLEPAFLRELEAMRRHFRSKARSSAQGAHLAKKRGGNAEFAEHRPYAPGDDLRRVDWSAFARAGTPVTKTFRAEEDVVVRIVVDASRSSASGSPSKLDVAKRLAAGLAYLTLVESERTQVVAARERGRECSGPVRGRASLPRVLHELEALQPDGGTDLATSIDDTLARNRRPGSLVVVSDFFDPGPWDVALKRAAARGHDVSLVHVLADEELTPPWDGDVALVCSETGETLEMTFDEGVRRAYEQRLGTLFHALATLATRVDGSYVRVVGDADMAGSVRRIVGRSVDRWASSSS
jgi:uncharacterized protein (DUF58 family)